MTMSGYSLVDLNSNAEVLWALSLPSRLAYEPATVILRLDAPKLGDQVTGTDGHEYRIVERWYDEAMQPGVDQKKTGETPVFDGTRVNVTPVFGAMTAGEIVARDAAAAEANRAATYAADTARTELLEQLRTATASQIDTWVGNHVTDLASAKVVLATVIKAIALIVRE